MRQGEIWWADLPPPVGRRPVLLLSRNEAYRIRASVTIAIVTTTVRNIPSEVHLGPNDGLPKVCVVNLDTIMTIKKSSIDMRICALSELKWACAVQALKFVFAIK